MQKVFIRQAKMNDLPRILSIYNQGIEDRIATLETQTKDMLYIQKWFNEHQGRHVVLVAEVSDQVIGWASLNPYSHRCAYSGVADLSIYIHREYRGKGIGNTLLLELENEARKHNFHKIVLFTFPFNKAGQGLYQKSGYRTVGVFEQQGMMDGKLIDVMIMEKLIQQA
ncbi:arsinothricin resistance N-acetyltransferase ArsN1 family A [Paenibacillus sp. P13VS]|uniref:arsinothricin resistance N-acetyltransferase ArsN1 family A n=1 Tax=Paenibacillus sp. P13VS TaxID=2697367 RepID=UPI00187BB47C|nr:arsinothricin resistance N-acetyltransferase ArsN1 family A [Paenibacillus sp. P13VS]MBE7680100.1 GNAT family N-acetyltransferase [Paenibacillus sp. P13VS]